MSNQIFFIFDSHCPWSYATTPLLQAIQQAYPDMPIHLLHAAYYDGGENIGIKTIEQVEADSHVSFSANYHAQRKIGADSTICANLIAWAQNKLPHQVLDIVCMMQDLHFQQGLTLREEDDFADLVKHFKLSAPKKAFAGDKLSKDAEENLLGVEELQEVIETQSIPALLLAKGDELILLNHHLYLKHPEKIVEAVELELADHH
ncbi:hypothetical protein C2869_19840 [Saccharobesus litoralis]|uniref:DSBA-like thioredoxin domain-containing protein n=1 Tax=Saccharobesus litoralis TaxID=2172099 RepID=A0A2S0VWG4_9ALTE|nr:hypothetical protein [Saccharobesus litoralis]AWB68512.1 hypothetical protein C2869_19840 [Saccharobesus litoralis]